MHWTRRVGLLCLGLVSLGLTNVSSGQDPITATNGGVVYLDDISGSAFLSRDGSNYLLFHKVVGDGVGHTDGFTRLGVRSRLWQGFGHHLFGEAHALVTDDSRAGFNLGGGYRKQSGIGIFGIHGWFDDYESNNNNRYRQITGGVEYLSPNFDLRANGYIPIDDRENFVRVVDPGDDPFYLGNQIVTSGIGTFERAFYGWDVEGGGPVPLAQNWLRAYAGAYQLLFSGDTATGVRVRAEARFMEGVNLNLVASNDDKFGTNLNLGVEVRFRGTMPTRFQSGYTADRRFDQVRRTWNIQINEERDSIIVPLTRPGTVDPIFVSFIDNTTPAGGDGSFEMPFDFLPDAVADADLILVRRGVGDTLGNITLADSQRLLGEGLQHFVDTDRLGVIPLPTDGFDPTGAAPILRAAGMGLPIVTLANSNEVRSFELAATDGIFGTDIDSFDIDSITSTEITNGINIVNAGGTGFISNIDFEVMPGGTGIAVSNATMAPLDLTADAIAIDGGDFGVIFDADGADITFAITDLTVANTADTALVLAADGADLTGTADNVVVDGNAGTGVAVLLSNATGTTTFDGLQASGNGVDGVRVVATMGTDYNLNILDSTIDFNIDDNIDTCVVDMGSVLNLFVDPTTMDGAGNNAFEFLVADEGTLNATFLDVSLTGAANDAIQGTVLGDSTAILDFINFDASGSMDDGLDLFVSGGSALTANFTLGNFDNSTNSAVDVLATSGSTVDLAFQGVTADNMSADGNVVWRASTGGQLTSTWNGGSISNGVATGVRLDATGMDTSIDATLSNTNIDMNGGAGVDASLIMGMNAANLSLSLDTVTTNMNGSDGVRFLTSGSGVVGTLSTEALTSTGNGDAGLRVIGEFGAVVNADLQNSDFSSNGTVAPASGVFVSSDGLNTQVNATIDAVTANSNAMHGLEFLVNNMGSLLADIGSEGIGPSTASLNGASGIEVSGTNADEVILLGAGLNVFQQNGQSMMANGINFNVNGANLAVASISGTVTESNGDGININLQDVTSGAIEIIGDGVTTSSMNAGDGIQIDLLNTNLTDTLVGARLLAGLTIDSVGVSDNDPGFDGIRITADNSDLTLGSINNITSRNNVNGIAVNLTNGSDWNLDVTNNFIAGNSGVGILLASDSSDMGSTSILNVIGNDLVSNEINNVQVDLSGSADVELHVDQNIIDGDGRVQGFTTGVNFVGSTLSDSGFIPPDTMGAVGTNHVSEMINGTFAVYDKTDGSLVSRVSLNTFWANVQGVTLNPFNSVFDPRIIYDPTIDRWIASVIDGGGGNTIFVAVSETDDPTGIWRGVQFVGDSVQGIRFNDFDTLGVDADGIYIATNNFGGPPTGNDLSIYVIPKADLLGAVPTLANLTRFENLSVATFGGVIQPVIDFGASDGSASLLATRSFAGTDLFRTDIDTTDPNNPILGAPTLIPVPAYQTPDGGTQPNLTDLEHDSARFWSNAIEVNGTLWATHSFLTTDGTDGVRWYQIDEATNAVLQTGTIEDPNLDYLYPSISVNTTGQAVIGFSIVGPSQFASTGAAFGDTMNGVMTFLAPVTLQAGVDNYNVTFGSGRNRWGDYSASVLDPDDENTFWTFQLSAVGLNEWGVGITEINFDPGQSISGMTVEDGISLNMSGDAILRDSSFDLNNITGNQMNAIEIDLSGNATIDCLFINGNTISDNGNDVPSVNNTGTGTINIK